MGSLSENDLATLGSGNEEETSEIYSQGAIRKIQYPARQLLEDYSKISPSHVDAHVADIRERGFTIRPYPCIGHLRFLALSLSLHPLYPEVLLRVGKGQAFLDLGCCFGQELRKLAFDGAPSDNLYGVEMIEDFVNLGYELFRDRQTLGAKFFFVDIMQVLESGHPLLSGKMDIVYASSFFHLFSLTEQVELAKAVISMLRPAKGSLLLGRQMGSVKPGAYTLRKLQEGEVYQHDIASFERMWEEVAQATGTSWSVEATLDDEELGYKGNEKWGHPDMRRLRFAIRRL